MRFDPPLSRVEGWLVWLWFVVSGAAAAGMVLGVFWWWVMFFFTIPFVFLAWAAPTAWIYLTTGLLLWLPLRRRPGRAAAAVVAGLAIVAFAVPWVMNRQLDAMLAQAVADDRGGPVTLGQPAPVALLEGNGNGYCGTDCMRFLITGRATAVLFGPQPGGPPVPAMPVRRIRVVPATGPPCPPLPENANKLVSRWDFPLLPRAHCVVIDTAPLGSARHVFLLAGSARYSEDRLPGLRLRWRRHEIFGWQGSAPVLLMRRSAAEAKRIAAPLTLWPMSGADTSSPAHWGEGAKLQAGRELPYGGTWMVKERMYVPEYDDRRPPPRT